MNFDVITVGNAVIDAFLSLQDTNTHIHLNQAERKLCVSHGEKILLDSCEFMLGGNACNVAVGLKRSGLNVALMAEIGSDEFSEKIINGLKREKVDLSLLQRGSAPSSFSIGLNFKGERTLFVAHYDRKQAFKFHDAKTKAIYLTSVGRSWRLAYETVGQYIQHHPETILAFNPGSVQYQDGVSSFSFLFPMTSILFVNKEEAQRIVGKSNNIGELLKELKKTGARIVCLTDGEKGAYAMDENDQMYHQEKITCPVVERTGAGDAFASGFLAAYLYSKSMKDSMLWGVHNASSVISHIGSQEGLLTKQEYEAKIR